MSAYQLENEKFQKIANWLFYEARNSGMYSARPLVLELLELEVDHLMSEDDLKQRVGMVVRNYYNLNRLAMVTRYSEPYLRDDEAKFIPIISYNTIPLKEMIRLCKCLRYQCAEYMTSTTGLFRELDKFIGKLCEVLFNQMEEVGVRE